MRQRREPGLPLFPDPTEGLRFAALELPRLPWQVLVRDRPNLADRPVALFLRIRQREEVIAVSDAAFASGVRPGQTVSEARALASELEAVPAEPSRDARVLREVAEALLSLAPFVEIAPPRALLLDASAARLVAAERVIVMRASRDRISADRLSTPPGLDEEGAEEELLWGEAVLERVRMLGLSGRLVVAGTPDAARVLAATGAMTAAEKGDLAIRLIAPGDEAGALAGVALSRVAAMAAEDAAPFGKARSGQSETSELLKGAGPLLLPPIRNESWELLARLGIGALGDLPRLPRATLMTRLGVEAERLLALARGGRRRPLRPYWPQEPLRERMELDSAVDDAAALVFVGRHLAERLAARLQGRGVAASRLVLELETEAPREEIRTLPGGDSSAMAGDAGSNRERLVLELARPVTRAAPLVDVLRERLSSLQLRAPVKALSLEVGESATRRQQLALGERPQALEALDSVLSRLVSRFGEEGVGALHLEQRWEPERAFRVAPFRPRALAFEARAERGEVEDEAAREETSEESGSESKGGGAGSDAPAGAGRPTRLFPPEEVELELDGPEGRRVLRAIRRQGHRHRVAEWGGQEKLSTAWWDTPSVRDYVAVLLVDGTRMWLYREPDGRWWLHGVFD